MTERAERQKMQDEFSFNRQAGEVAEYLKGAVLLVEKRVMVIADAEGFPATSITRKNYADAQNRTPGDITAIPYRATMLPNITVADRGLVMPKAVSVVNSEGRQTLIAGPGRTATTLGLRPGEVARIVVVDSKNKLLRLVREGNDGQISDADDPGQSGPAGQESRQPESSIGEEDIDERIKQLLDLLRQ